MDIFNEKQILSAEEMESLKGGGHWVKIQDKWYWVEGYSIIPPKEEE